MQKLFNKHLTMFVFAWWNSNEQQITWIRFQATDETMELEPLQRKGLVAPHIFTTGASSRDSAITLPESNTQMKS